MGVGNSREDAVIGALVELARLKNEGKTKSSLDEQKASAAIESSDAGLDGAALDAELKAQGVPLSWRPLRELFRGGVVCRVGPQAREET